MGLKIINPIYDVIMSKMPFGSDKNSRIFEKKDTIESQELLNILNKEKQTPIIANNIKRWINMNL